jgi:2-dehydro-3-deoxyphosphooctonate aldolase (KDO 8-P synthase)
MKQIVEVASDVAFGDGRLALIAGPCVIESRDHSLRMAEAIAAETRARGLPLVFKSSYDKANRTSGSSFRGPGVDEGTRILEEVRDAVGVPVLTDVHTVEEVGSAAAAVDVLQIPAFLCRQTDLILSAAATGMPLNVKKGQFLAPWDVQHVVEKVESEGNRRLLITERGTCFGYNNLIVDFKGLCVLGELGYPVVLDVTHSLQLPGAGKGVTAGERRFAEPLARAGVAAGVDALFLEVHDNPDEARSDASTQFPLELFGRLLDRLCRIHEALAERPLQIDAPDNAGSRN